MRLALIFGFALLLAGSAADAQTTGCGSSSLSCQQLATQDAQAAGIDPATFVAQINAESSFNPNVGCNSSGACGIAQFLPGTAAQFGINPQDPVASLQAAATYDSQLVAQYGSLTSALEHYSGGLTPVNPGDYGPVFAAAAAADAGTPAAQQAGITVTADPTPGTTTTISQAATAAGVTSGSTGSDLNPYTYIYNQLQTGILNPILASVTNVEVAIRPWIISILTLSVMFMAVGGLWGKFPLDSIFYRLIRISLVVSLVAVGSPWYQNYVIGLFEGLPVQLSNAIVGASSANPAAPFDIVLHAFNATDANTLWAWPPLSISGWASAIKLGLAWLLLVVFISFMFAAWLSVQILLAIALMLGPIFVLGWLFDSFNSWASRWVNACLMLGAAEVATTSVTAFFLNVINGYIGQVQSVGTNGTYNLIGVVAIIISLGTATAALTRLVQFIAAAEGAPSLGGFQRFISAVEKGAAQGAEVAVVAFAK